jgi:hypothetical protein
MHPAPAPTAADTASAWLAQADPHGHAHALSWWTSSGKAMLAAGTRWDVIKTAADLGRAAARHLTRALPAPGPAWVNTAEGCAFFLTEPGTAATWGEPDTACITHDRWLWVPDPDGVPEPDMVWLIRPHHTPRLTAPAHIAAALRAATRGGPQ